MGGGHLRQRNGLAWQRERAAVRPAAQAGGQRAPLVGDDNPGSAGHQGAVHGGDRWLLRRAPEQDKQIAVHGARRAMAGARSWACARTARSVNGPSACHQGTAPHSAGTLVSSVNARRAPVTPAARVTARAAEARPVAGRGPAIRPATTVTVLTGVPGAGKASRSVTPAEVAAADHAARSAAWPDSASAVGGSTGGAGKRGEPAAQERGHLGGDELPVRGPDVRDVAGRHLVEGGDHRGKAAAGHASPSITIRPSRGSAGSCTLWGSKTGHR